MTLSKSHQQDLATLGLRVLDAQDLSARDPGFDPDNLKAGIAACPKHVSDVADVVRWCSENQIGIVPQGGRTGLAGGAVSASGQLIMMMDQMASIREIDTASAVAVVDAGVTLLQLEDAVARHGFTVGIDLAARGSCTIGGMTATNAGGSEAFRNGTMQHRVLGLEVVLPDGTVMSDLKKVIKANEGYDIKQLFIGAEGTLGIITGIALRLEVAAGARKTILAASDSAAPALSFFHQLRGTYRSKLLAAEIMWDDYFKTTTAAQNCQEQFSVLQGDVYVIAEFEDIDDEDALLAHLADSVAMGHISDAVLAKNDHERAQIWSIREETFLIDQLRPGGCWFDVSLPLSKLDDFVQTSRERLRAFDPDLGVYVMGHLGDGNLHYTIAKDTPVNHLHSEISAALLKGISETGGSFSAEHGIGVEKRQALATFCDPAKLALIATIKASIDPLNIMNPGKVLP